MTDIKEVAKLAGVSIATVSRVVNGKVCVKPETRERVLKIIEQVKYSPNLQGRHLRNMLTKRVLVVIDDVSLRVYSKVVRGIEECARENGYTATICTARDDTDDLAEHLNMLYNRSADGAILLFAPKDYKQLKEFGKSYPIVSCEQVPEDIDICYVGIDNTRACFDIVEYLISKNRRKIALFGADNSSYSSRLRDAGYRDALYKANIPVDEALVFHEGLSYYSGIRAAKKMLLSALLPDAIIVYSDRAAIGAIKQLTSLGIRVPEDIAVISFDNTELSEMYIPSVTVLEQPRHDMGYNAMDLMIRKLHGRQIRNKMILPHGVIIRETT